VAAGVTVFVLAARHLEHRARRRAGVGVAGLALLAEQAGAGRAAAPAHRVPGLFVPAVIALAVGTWGFWVARGAASTAFAAAVAVLLVACPAALGLAGPTALLVGTRRAARRGILVSGREALERSSAIDTVVLGRSCTPTAGAATVTDADDVRPDAARVVAELRALGLEPVLLTDNGEGPARAVAAAVGIDEVVADVLPQEKAGVVARLQADGRVVAMVGDGASDAAALARADLGIAVAAPGTAAADLTLVLPEPGAVAEAVRLSRRVRRTIRTNLAWAFCYHLLALPVAAAALLDPLTAGIAMAAGTALVVGNGLRPR
jgi:cation transport ATPase